MYAVLLGNKTAVKGGSGKVVASNRNDKIFIYYSDHGGPGILGITFQPFVTFEEDQIKLHLIYINLLTYFSF